MLHKSFKPAKCKTALKLAVSRIKLLKNKRDAQVKQLKRELAHLLESGQDQTARIRVEHVVREKKAMAAYDLIEIYCELIAARLPIIESQKNCPIDLKEAVASVIFASPRCADLPELMDVRKHFTAKYGKEFIAAAVELRPDCGVSRLMVEKLSAKSPDGPTKIKILTAIAEEHNVKWDPESFGEKEMKPPEDLLNGPNTFEQASKAQELQNNIDRGPPNLGAPVKHYEKHDAPVNSFGSNSRSSPHATSVPSTAVDPSMATPSGTSHTDLRPFATEFRHSYASEQSRSSAGRQGWNVEFKDATAAAQAAAESAELASLAARAAAELSSQGRISSQHSAESKKASVFESKNEGPQNYAYSRLHGENPVNNTSYRSNSGVHVEQGFENEQNDLAGLAERFQNLKSSNKSSQSASSKSSSSSMDDYPQVNDLQMAGRHSRKTSYGSEKSDLSGEVNMKRESRESQIEFPSEVQNGLRSGNVGYFEEVTIRKQSSNVSSHSRIPSDEHNVVSNFSRQKFTEEAVKEPFIFYEGIEGDSNDRNSYDNPAVVFDDSGSDDELKFNVSSEYNGHNNSYYFSESRKPSSHLLASTSGKSLRLSMRDSLGKSTSESPFVSDTHTTFVFSEPMTSDAFPSQANDLLSVTFDDSDRPSSDSEGELDDSKRLTDKGTGTSSDNRFADSSDHNKTQNVNTCFIGSSLEEKENMGSNRKKWTQQSAVDLDVQVHSKRNQAIEVFDETKTDRKVDSGYSYGNQTSSLLAESQSNSNCINQSLSSVEENVQKSPSSYTLKDSEPAKESSPESGRELNFGTLTGGFRNKGYRYPPYRSNASNSSLASKQIDEDDSTRIEPPSSFSKGDSGSGAPHQETYKQLVHQKENKKATLGAPVPYSDASDHRSDEELSRQTLASSQDPDFSKGGLEGNNNSGVRSFFDSDKSDSEEDFPKVTVTSKPRSVPGLSRRTKAPLSSSEGSFSLKSRVPFKSSETADHVDEQKLSAVSSDANDSQVKPPSQTKNSFYQASFEQGKSPEDASFKPVSQYNRPMHRESSRKSSYPAITRQNHSSQSSSREQPSNPPPRTVASDGAKSTTKSDPHPDPPSRENSINKASHVHPKLSRPSPEPRRSSREENRKSSSREQPSNPPPRTVASDGAKSTTKSDSHDDPPSRENSINKESHVHPKLPDYDTLTAHLLSLRQNRQ